MDFDPKVVAVARHVVLLGAADSHLVFPKRLNSIGLIVRVNSIERPVAVYLSLGQ